MKSYIVEDTREEAIRLKNHFEKQGYICGELTEKIEKTTRYTKTKYIIECEEK